MFEDVFEPLDEIVGEGIVESTDEWSTGDTWDTGEKEDMWRSDPAPGGVWSVDPADQTVQPRKPDPPISQPGPMSSPAPANDQNDTECEETECEDECEPKDCDACENTEKCDKDSGLFDDLFLDIF